MKRFFSFLLLSSSLFFLPLSADSSDTAPPSSSQQSILSPKAPDTAPALPETHPLPMTEETVSPTYQGAFTKMLLTLAGLLALVFITIWLLRKLTQGRIGAFGKKQINVLERRPLSPKSILYVVEVGGKRILVAESQLEIKTLATLDAFSEDA